MKRISSLQGTVAIRFSPDEAAPETAVLTRDLVTFIGDKYDFSLRPELPPGLPNDLSLLFQSGQMVAGDRKIPIHQLVIQIGGTALTAKDTDVADLIIDDVHAALDETFGFKIANSIRARYYASAIVVEFPSALEKQLTFVGRAKEILEREMPHRTYPFDVKRIGFGFAEKHVPLGATIEDFPNGDFLIERRLGEPQSSNRYMCSGPFRTSELERITRLVEGVMRD